MNLKRFVQKIVKCYCFDERIKFEHFDFDNILKDIRFVLASIKQINLLEFMMNIYIYLAFFGPEKYPIYSFR